MVESPDQWSTESEMEVALEVVNHVPPVMQDRLIERLRAAEDARTAAEDRAATAALAAAAEADAEAEAAAGARASQVASASDEARSTSYCWWVVVFLLAAVVYFGGAADPSSWSPAVTTESSQAPSAALPQKQPSAALAASGSRNDQVCGTTDADEHNLSDPITLACEATLGEVQKETEALRRHRDELAHGYGRALEEMSQWLSFLRVMREGRDAPDAGAGSEALTRPELEAHCLQAARPGRQALEVVLQNLTGARLADAPQALARPTLGQQLATKLGQLREENAQLRQQKMQQQPAV